MTDGSFKIVSNWAVRTQPKVTGVKDSYPEGAMPPPCHRDRCGGITGGDEQIRSRAGPVLGDCGRGVNARKIELFFVSSILANKGDSAVDRITGKTARMCRRIEYLARH